MVVVVLVVLVGTVMMTLNKHSILFSYIRLRFAGSDNSLLSMFDVSSANAAFSRASFAVP